MTAGGRKFARPEFPRVFDPIRQQTPHNTQPALRGRHVECSQAGISPSVSDDPSSYLFPPASNQHLRLARTAMPNPPATNSIGNQIEYPAAFESGLSIVKSGSSGFT